MPRVNPPPVAAPRQREHLSVTLKFAPWIASGVSLSIRKLILIRGCGKLSCNLGGNILNQAAAKENG